MERRSLDGIRRPVRPWVSQGDPVSVAPSGPKRRRWWIGMIALLLLVVTSLGIAVRPLLAAVPLTSWSDRLAMSHLAQPGRYLVMFQNPRELRPSGGFLGSFAVVTLGWGFQVKDVQVETNIYQRDAAYAATLPLRFGPLDPRGPQPAWAMHESNWAIDFGLSARTVAWFYEHEGGEPVNGVIALDARILERILRLTGPIDLPRDDLYLTADNVIDTLQEEIEKNYWVREGNADINQPKTVLADLLPILLTKLRQHGLADVAALAVAAADSKELQVMSRDETLARVLAAHQWDGHLRVAEAADFLSLNEANASGSDGLAKTRGAKSSHEIDRGLVVSREADGIHHLTLKRSHHGANVWPGGPNQSWLRAVVPAGATLIAASRNGRPMTDEVVIGDEAGATTFGFWSRLNPGDSEVLELTYQASRSGLGSLLYQQPAGVPSLDLELWDGTTLRFSGSLTGDRLFPAAS